MNKKYGFGFKEDTFKSAIKRYGIWPITVWDCDYTDKLMQKMKIEIGDGCQLRAGTGSLVYQSKKHESRQKGSGCNKDFTRTGSWNAGGGLDWMGKKITESIFNPAVVVWILNLFASENDIVYDPFAGGGTRAIVTAKKGLEYIGVELRQEEVDAINERCKYNEVNPKIICSDSKLVPQIESDLANFLVTCPPYYDMEKYDGGKNDISMAKSYKEFLLMLYESIKESFRILKSGSLSCWVVGLYRDKEGVLLPLHHDIARLHNRVGFKLKEEIVLNLRNTGAIQRVGNFEKGNRFLIRTHEYCLVFKKP